MSLWTCRRRCSRRAREHNGGLDNVEWVHGDGLTLGGIADGSADACLSWVVFQHIPDPEVTLGYIREVGRVLRPGGWAVLQVSNDPEVHRASGWRDRALALLGRGPRGLARPEWLGSAVDLDRVREAARDGGATLAGVEGEDTQYCVLLLRKVTPAAD